MKLFAPAILLLSFLATDLFAQTKQENCAALAGPLLSLSDAFASMSSVMVKMDFEMVAGKVGGIEGEKLRDLGVSRDALMPNFLEFLRVLEETAMAMRVCAR